MSAPSNRWADLRPRLLSAAVMVAVAIVGIGLGGVLFSALLCVLAALMLWELASMTQSDARMALLLAGLGGLCLVATFAVPPALAVVLLLAPAVAFALTPRREKGLATLWAAAAMVAAFGMIWLRIEVGIPALVWVVLVVVTSDVMGYFVGRILGGPKFWPAISPKKTWSGTAAGWIGAAVVGLVFWQQGYAPAAIIPLSALICFAGQMGDIAESWIKRRTGVKDSSHLIPGHGGFLDRFDAMTGAVVLVMALSLIFTLPLPVGG